MGTTLVSGSICKMTAALQFPQVFPQGSNFESAKAIQSPHPGLKINEQSWQNPRHARVCPRGYPPVTAADKCIIGNGVVSLLWQLRCHCSPDHNKCSSLSNTTVVATFANVYGDIVYAQTWHWGIDPEKLYRATFICQYGLCCCIVWPSFLFGCFVQIWATCKNFLGKWFTAPPGKKFPVRLWQERLLTINKRNIIRWNIYRENNFHSRRQVLKCF